VITREYSEELVQSITEKKEEPPYSADDEEELIDENSSDSSTFEIPGLEGTLQTADDV
jgi:hypothetical protein